MKLLQLVHTVSGRSGVDPQTTRKVLETAFGILSEQLAADENVRLEGLGSFVHKPSTEPGKRSRTVFRPWSPKDSADTKEYTKSEAAKSDGARTEGTKKESIKNDAATKTGKTAKPTRTAKSTKTGAS
jgi:hypothetical protein